MGDGPLADASVERSLARPSHHADGAQPGAARLQSVVAAAGRLPSIASIAGHLVPRRNGLPAGGGGAVQLHPSFGPHHPRPVRGRTRPSPRSLADPGVAQLSRLRRLPRLLRSRTSAARTRRHAGVSAARPAVARRPRPRPSRNSPRLARPRAKPAAPARSIGRARSRSASRQRHERCSRRAGCARRSTCPTKRPAFSTLMAATSSATRA